MKTKEAEVTTIYVVESYNEKYQDNFLGKKNGELVSFHNEADSDNYEKVIRMQSSRVSCDYRVKETNLLDWVMISAEETTSPIGVSNILFTRENEENETVEVRRWSGSKSVFVESFDSQEEADDYIFTHIYEHDFSSDDQRDTWFTQNKEEADERVIELYAEMLGVDLEVAESIVKHSAKIESIKAERERVWREQEEVRKIAEKQRFAELVPQYVALIQPQSETFKETAHRLSEALNGEIIDSKVFYQVVKEVRSKFSK